MAGDPSFISGQAIGVVVIVITIMAAIAWILRRASPSRARLAVTVETAIPLGERRSLVIVAVEGRRLLLGLTPTQIALVTELGTSFGASLTASLGTPPDPAPDAGPRP